MGPSTVSGQAVLLTVEEAAKRLRIGRTSIYRLVSTRAIETVTVGRLRRVPEECLAEYVTRLRHSTFVAMPLRSPRPGGWRGFLRVLAGRGEMLEIWRR
jgi:excisionase family DNA binding protein